MTDLQNDLITKLVNFPNAEAYAVTAEKYLFVFYLIEAEDVRPTDDLVELIEDRLEDVIL